jgi:hypothetical protein
MALSIPEFAAKIKAKYPDYSGIEDTVLVNKIVAKYPDYASQVDMGQQEPKEEWGITKAANAISSIKNDLEQRAANAGEASVTGRNIFEKGLQIAGEAGGFVGDIAKRGLEAGSALIGSVPGSKNISDEQIAKAVPEGVSRAVSSIFGPIAEVYHKLDKNTQKDLDAVVNIVSSIPIGIVEKEAGKQAVKKTVEASADIAAGAAKGAGKTLQSAGEKIQFSTIKPTARDMQNGFDLETVYKHDLQGSLPQVLEKTDKKLVELSGQLKNELEKNPSARVNIYDALAKTESELKANNVENFGRNSNIQKVIDNYLSEIEKVAGPDGTVGILDAQKVKRSVGKDGAWQFGMKDKDAVASEEVANSLYTNLKTAIEQAAPEGSQIAAINKQISELIPVEQAVIRRIPVAARNEAIGLKDVIGAGAALINWHAWPLLAANMISKNPAVGKAMYKAGRKLQGENAPAIVNESIKSTQRRKNIMSNLKSKEEGK